MVGASLACALMRSNEAPNLRIALVEAMPLQPAGQAWQPSYDARSTAIAYGARSFFERTGLWSRLSEHLTPIRHIHVSDRGHFGATRLHAQEEGVAALGYVVENHWLGQVLLDALQTDGEGCIDFICPARITALTRDGARNWLTLERDGAQEQLSAELVVMADGGRSDLREQLGIHYHQQSYRQHALVANVSLDRPHRHIAYERFTEAGPMALLPGEALDGQVRCGLIWTLPDTEVEQVLALDESAFLARLQAVFGYRAGRFVHVGERYHYPLKLSLAEEQVRPGLVVLGNAAHALHPIAGQGYNLALRGVIDLAENLLESHRLDQPLGAGERLQSYMARRRADQQRTIEFSDRTMRLFSNRHPLLVPVRDLGLQLLDLCPAARTLFARAAMGLDHPAINMNGS